MQDGTVLYLRMIRKRFSNILDLFRALIKIK